MTIVILGHRGMGPTSRGFINQFLPPNVAPENSLLAFQQALDNGAQGVEMDVYLTHDNAVVVSRDDILDRNVDGYHSCWEAKDVSVLGKISEKTFAELQDKKYCLGSGQFIPTLNSVIDLIIRNNKSRDRKYKINIELQGDSLLLAKLTWETIRQYVENPKNNLSYDDFMVNSFNFKMLVGFRAAQMEQGFTCEVELLLGVYTSNMFGKEELLPGWVPVEMASAKPKLDAKGLPIPKDKVDSKYINDLIVTCKQYSINYLDIISSDLRSNLLEICRKNKMGISMACNTIRAKAEYSLWYRDASCASVSDLDLELSQLQHIFMLAKEYPEFTFYYKCDHLEQALALMQSLVILFEEIEKTSQDCGGVELSMYKSHVEKTGACMAESNLKLARALSS